MRERCLKARTKLFGELYKEIVGPGSGESLNNGTPCSLPDEEHELITDLPEDRYYVGVLYPTKDNKMNADNDTSVPDTGGLDEEIEATESAGEEVATHGDLAATSGVDDDSMDEIIALSMQDRPSSIGITFIVNRDMDNVVVDVSFATYRHAIYTDCQVPHGDSIAEYASALDEHVYIDGSMMRLKHFITGRDVRVLLSMLDLKDDGSLIRNLYKLAAQCNPRKAFVRIPHSETVSLSLDGKPVNVCGVGFAYMRAVKNAIANRKYTVTIMLYNGGAGHYDGTNTIFQPKIEVTSAKNPSTSVLAYDDNMRFSIDDEERSLALLYRSRKHYATGHGISAFWDISSTSWRISTDLMPWTEVPQIDFEYALRMGVEKKSLSLKYLSDLSSTTSDEKLSALGQLISVYEKWIGDLNISSLEMEQRGIANRHVALCRDAAKRMREGLDCLRKNLDAMRAFSLANRAMLMQMKHYRDIVQRVPVDEDASAVPYRDIDYEDLDKDINDPNIRTWRPFQAAFFLMNICGLTDTEPHPDETEETERDRNIADIIWFPTGGGKTEAYLALTAFVIFYRRLKYPDVSGGTAVLMRYTLRLLTSQQFSRASTLICACDRIRAELWNKSHRRDTRWKEPITIGLWIGGDHTPNKNTSYEPKGAKEYRKSLIDPSNGPLEHRNDYFNKFQVLTCPWCGASLVPPAHDEGQNGVKWGYRMDDHGRFYIKCVRPGCPYENKLPVQVVDEELYRTPPTLLFATVDKFAMIAWNKEVGSFFGLGTNNRAPELIVQDELHLISGPLGSIVGLYETAIDSLCSSKGVRPKIVASTATIRLAGDQCRHLYNRTVRQFPPSGLDASNSFFAKEAETNEKPGRLYVGVFPSGKTKAMLQTKVMSTLLQYVYLLDAEDNIKDQYWTLTAYFNSLRDLGKCAGLVDDDIKDFIKRLCRRVATDKIIRSIAMADELTSRVSTTALVKCLKKLEKTTYSKENQKAKNFAVNVLLATNMISVGVDVDRLNLMTVVGQPKLTSEYIQATSRVGREYPGLVCVLYDATKSRDRSHFEQFHAYHESFYRYVEPTSVTPFSQPALDRALHAVLVALARHRDESLYNDADAQNFTRDYPFLDNIKETLLRRIDSVLRHSHSGEKIDLNIISAQIDTFFESWAARAESTPKAERLYYGQRFMLQPPKENEHRLLRPFGTWSINDPAKETLTSMRNVDQTLASRMLIWEEE
jgi:hypothetical protein